MLGTKFWRMRLVLGSRCEKYMWLKVGGIKVGKYEGNF